MTAFFTLLSNASFLNTILIICAVVGGFFAFRNGKRSETVRIQKENNEALLTRIELLEKKISDLEKENHLQQHIIDTITSALKQRGMVITIDGDMVTIADAAGRSTSRKRMTTTNKTIQVQPRSEDV